MVTTKSYQLVQDYPHDPRVQYLRGVALLQANDAAAAEPYLRAALSLNEKNPAFRQSSPRIRAVLALDLTVLHRRDEARNMAAPVCAGGDKQALALLNKASLCSAGR
jgi:predicted Zn-dependent protease